MTATTTSIAVVTVQPVFTGSGRIRSLLCSRCGALTSRPSPGS
jgi:hypothetical protein